MNYYSAPREELFDKPVCVWGSTLDKSILLLGLFIILLYAEGKLEVQHIYIYISPRTVLPTAYQFLLLL